MPKPSPEVERCAAAFTLAVPDQIGRGQAGERLGRGTGSSLEFQDRRNYAVGDDVRHLDWRAFGRTDQLFVRVYREEIQPRVECLLDISKSMAVDPRKAQLAIDLTSLIVKLAIGDGFRAKILTMGDSVLPFEPMILDKQGIEFVSTRPLQESAGEMTAHVTNGSLRFIISDFLSPFDERSLVRSFASRAGHFTFIQILSADEARPTVGDALRLVDCETNETVDLVLDSATVELYQTRLQRLEASLASETRRAQGQFIKITPSAAAERFTIETACRETLLPAGMITTR